MWLLESVEAEHVTCTRRMLQEAVLESVSEQAATNAGRIALAEEEAGTPESLSLSVSLSLSLSLSVSLSPSPPLSLSLSPLSLSRARHSHSRVTYLRDLSPGH